MHIRESTALRRLHLATLPAILMVAGVAFAVWAPLGGRRRNDAAPTVLFFGMTNTPGLGRAALLTVSNGTAQEIVCWGYGYLEVGETGTFTYPVPSGEGAWSAGVKWQRQPVSQLDYALNEWRWK